MSSSKNIESPYRFVMVIAGPTGIGKTAFAMELAEHIPVEIISADSRQIYRYMDIGTAKPTPEMRRKVRHHFIDILNPDQEYSAGQFGKDARTTVEEIVRRNNFPLVVGGSGLYIRALLEGFFQEDVKDKQIREQLMNRLQQEGAHPLYEELLRVDPAAAAKTHPNNPRRVIRALEVYYAAGIPLSQLQASRKDPASFPYLFLALNMPRKQLYQRINERVERMFEQGLVEEVRAILELGYSPKQNALNSVGYKEVIAYLNKEMNLFECKELIKQNTRRFAKRQLTWFRGQPNVQWVEVNSPEDLSQLTKQLINKHYRSHING